MVNSSLHGSLDKGLHGSLDKGLPSDAQKAAEFADMRAWILAVRWPMENKRATRPFFGRIVLPNVSYAS